MSEVSIDITSYIEETPKKSKTVLIVDDSVANLDILSELLYEYDVIDTIDAKEALTIANEEKIDLILLDIVMPEMDGYELCEALKKNVKTKDIPVIFITVKSDEESIEKAYDVGGADYVTKPFKTKELLARVKKELKIQDLFRQLKILATTDSLTKLYNRRYFCEVSKDIFNIVKREQEKMALLMIDIDKFKNINDTYGHDIGDKVIVNVADIIRRKQRKSDISCRYGGEEFVMLLPNTDVTGAKILAMKLRESVENELLLLNYEKKLHYTVSIGVSEVDFQKEENISKVLKRADEALYEAKRSGRNRVVVKIDSKH